MIKTKLNIEALPDEFVESLVYKDDISEINTTLNNKQEVLVSGTNIKTINGNSILGEGDIIIPQYDDSEIIQTIQEMDDHVYEIENVTAFSLNNLNNNKFDKIKIIQHYNSDTEYVITPNQFHIWVGVDSLELQLGEEENGVVNEYMFQFSSGNNGTTLTLPYQIKWSDDLVPDFSDPSFIYQISIVNNCATMLKFKK